jgi:hypothetical protein
VGIWAADIAVERQFARFCGGLGDGQRHAENGVGAEARLVRGTIEVDHRLIDAELVERVEALDLVEDRGVDVLDCLGHALAEILLAAVAQLHGLMRAGGSARGHGGAAKAAIIEHHIDFDGRIAAAVIDLAAVTWMIEDIGKPFPSWGSVSCMGLS